MNDDVLTRNDNDELAVRTVSATEGSNASSYDDVFTRDTDGKLAVRVVGTGGGGGSVDYNRVVEKITAIPSAESSVVGKVYMYMGETNSTYTHGYIYECVATQEATAVAFSGSIVSSWDVADFVSYMQEGGSAYNEVTHGTLTYDASGGLWDLVGYDANGIEVLNFHEYTEDLEDFGCVFASETHQDGDSCQFTLTTEQSGKKWKRLDVQPNNGGGGGGSDPHNLGWYATESALTTAHPTANDGDWAIVGSTDTVWVWDSDTNAWKDTDQKGQVTSVNGQTGAVSLDINDVAPTQTGFSGYVLVTDGFVAGWGKPEIVQRSALPQASEEEVGKIYQYVGTTDANYTNGYFYKCVSDGATPAVYSWTAIEVQAGGGSSYTAGTGIDITGGVISVTSPTLQNNINSNNQLILLSSKTTVGSQSILIGAFSYNVNGNNTVAIGDHCGANGDTAVAIGSAARGERNQTVSIGAYSNSNFGTVTQGIASTAVGCNTKTDGDYSIALGYNAQSTATNAIQIGSVGATATTNSDANTLKVGNANGNFEMMSADGTIPTARLTKVNSTITLAAAGWSSNTQTVNVTGMTADGVVMVSPDPTDQSAYTSAGVLCTVQAAGTLTFTCDTVPSADIDVNVVML